VNYRFLLKVAFLSLVAMLQVAHAQGSTSEKYEALVSQGNTLLQAADNDQALELANQAIALNPRRWEAYALAGGALMNQENYQKALNNLNRAFTLAPKSKQSGLKGLVQKCQLFLAHGDGSKKPLSNDEASNQTEVTGPSVDDTISWINQHIDGKIGFNDGFIVLYVEGDGGEDLKINAKIPLSVAAIDPNDFSTPPSSSETQNAANPSPIFMAGYTINDAQVIWLKCNDASSCVDFTWKDGNDRCPGSIAGQYQPGIQCFDGYHDANGKPTAPNDGCDVFGSCSSRRMGLPIVALSKDEASHVLKALLHLMDVLQKQSHSDMF
jgi:tetratricopeptide (TPR) repeat protein